MPPFEITTVSTTARTVNASELGLVTATGAQLATVSLNSTASLLNLGSVVTQTTHAVRVENTAVATISNHGVMMGGGTLGTIDVYTGISDTRMNLHNTGTISTLGVLDTSAIVTRSGGQRIVNEGTISATFDQAIEILDELSLGIGNSIINTGLIAGGVGAGSAIYLQGAGADIIDNSGRIAGDVLMTGGGNDTLLNSGTITGNVSFSGTGRVVNSGTIEGSLLLTLGPGLHKVDLRGGFVGDGVIFASGNASVLVSEDNFDFIRLSGSGGEIVAWCDYALQFGFTFLRLRGDAVAGIGSGVGDTIYGSGNQNLISGFDGDDTLFGFGGNDTVMGGTGNDYCEGGFSADSLDGEDGNDTLDGGNGADILMGDVGNDSLVGGNGKDTLEGGEGADVLTGGASADLFIFRDGDFSLTSAIRDRISDFRSGIDTIDLSAIDANVTDAQDSAFVRVGAFTNVAGQLILRLDAGSLVVEGDLNGDGTADVSIRLNGVTATLATDIIL